MLFAHPTYALFHIGLALDLDLHSRIDQSLDLDQRRGRQVFAEIFDAARIDFRPLGDVGHENLHLDDMLRARAGRLQALVDHGNRDVELRDDVGWNAAVQRLADRAGDPDMRAGAGDVAIMADRPRQAGNDDALDVCHAWLAKGG